MYHIFPTTQKAMLTAMTTSEATTTSQPFPLTRAAGMADQRKTYARLSQGDMATSSAVWERFSGSTIRNSTKPMANTPVL